MSVPAPTPAVAGSTPSDDHAARVRIQREHELTREYDALRDAQERAELAGNDPHARSLRRMREEVAVQLLELGRDPTEWRA